MKNRAEHERGQLKRRLDNYSLFLGIIGAQFAEAAKENKAKCRRGCHECCIGFFGISLLDALSLNNSLRKVPAPVRKRVIAAANDQLDALEAQNLFSRRIPFLTSAADVDALARKSADMRCPGLDDKNRCMIYEYRPLLCRTFGPTIRTGQRSIVIKGCGHFSRDIPETDFPILSIYKDEDVLLKSLFKRLGIDTRRRIETIIPAALALDLKTWL